MNPSGQPFGGPGPQFGAPPPSGGNARELLNVPSILIIVMGAIGILFGLYGMVSSGANSEQLGQLLNDPNLPPAFKKAMTMTTGPMSKVSNLIGMLLDVLMIFGAVQMRNLKMYPLAIAATVISMLPCGGCCCLIGLPVGIWALVTLMKPEVKAQFS